MTGNCELTYLEHSQFCSAAHKNTNPLTDHPHIWRLIQSESEVLGIVKMNLSSAVKV